MPSRVVDRRTLDEILISLRKSARSKGGMSGLAKASGLNRAGLYRGLAPGGNPRIRSLVGLLENLGFELTIQEALQGYRPHVHARLPPSPGVGVPKGLLDTLVKRILGAAKPRQIWLFGSAAGGTMRKDSDVDLLVVEDRVRDKAREAGILRQAVGSLGWPLDIFVMSRREFLDTGDVVGSLAYPARTSGRLLYARP